MKHDTFVPVRAATPDDFTEIMRLCRMLYEENGALNVDWNIVAKVIMDGVNGNMATIGLIGPKGAIEGMIYLRISSLWYSGETLLEEMFNYVPPEYRKSRNAISLIEFGKACALKFKVPLLIGIISRDNTAAKVRLYRRSLGEPAGSYFMYNVRKWQDVQQLEGETE